ncbi:MAG: hypothetical protein ACRDL5_15560 [Solirubrobacteraceae bacterium]
MLEQAAGLTSGALQAIAELERQVVEADGGRLKLEWDSLRGRSGDRVEDLLWWEGERLRGYLGIYGFGDSPELAGMLLDRFVTHGEGDPVTRSTWSAAAKASFRPRRQWRSCSGYATTRLRIQMTPSA